MLQTLRLTALILLCAALGYGGVTATFVQLADGYGYGFAEGQRWRFIGAVLGAVAGVSLEALLRLRSRGWKFTLRQLMLGIAFVAITVTAIGWLAQWGASPL